MNGRNPVLSHPDRKISETFMEFAAPILPDPGVEDLLQRAETSLRVAHLVWNAVVIADVRGDHSYLDQVRTSMASKPELVAITEHLITRKRDRFADDERLIGLWEIKQTRDGFKLRADARNPHTMPGRSK